MKVALAVFPGTNCEHDLSHVVGRLLSARVVEIWHTERDLKKPDLVIIPGGFAHGDYLRTGALAKVSPVMDSIGAFAADGGPVLGICNGFQILCEAGLLPGALLRNTRRSFLSQFAGVRCEQTSTPFTRGLKALEVYQWPIAHGEGNYYCDQDQLTRLEGEGQIVFRYCGQGGDVRHHDLSTNPNGSLNSIAGVCNERRNVLGLMPHPERACETRVGYVGASSGLSFFEGMVEG